MATKSSCEPLVTIILTAFNHRKYIGETLRSIAEQTYSNIQLIVIDNASTDGTVAEIEKYANILPPFRFIRNQVNVGLCRAFNQALAIAEGVYIIDLSGDDILHSGRVERQVFEFNKLELKYAVVFTNAKHISAAGDFVRYHYKTNHSGKALMAIPSGDVYKNVLEKYFICTPTMMIRTQVLRELGGYDETLTFEDFDFWVRSSRCYWYFYVDEVLTSKRDVPQSLSSQVYQQNSRMLESYYLVCKKAYDLNLDQVEFDLLAARIRTFIRKCWYAQEYELADKFIVLLRSMGNPGWKTAIIVFLCRVKLPVNGIYRFYLRNLHKYR